MKLGDPAGGDGEAADAALPAEEACRKGGEFRRGDPLIGADVSVHEGLERLQDGQTAVDFRAEGSALNRQEFGDLSAFFGDEPAPGTRARSTTRKAAGGSAQAGRRSRILRRGLFFNGDWIMGPNVMKEGVKSPLRSVLIIDVQ